MTLTQSTPVHSSAVTATRAALQLARDPRFYAELTMRNRGFVTFPAQRRLAATTVLVAGCGSTGGAAVEPLARLGAQHFLLAEPGDYELNNLNRQGAFVHEIGRNKAAVCADRVRHINPGAHVEVWDEGITRANASDLVRRCDVVIDGVDVTEKAGWEAKARLHIAAAVHGRPVITGYDMGGTQYVRFYDYHRGDAPFDGRITFGDIERLSTWDLLRRVVPMHVIPVEMLVQARHSLTRPDEGLPQLVHASLLFGALASRMVLNLVEDRPVRRHTVVDSDHEVGTALTRTTRQLRKPVVAGLALMDLAVHRYRNRVASPDAGPAQ